MEETISYILLRFTVPRDTRVGDGPQAERLWWRDVVERSSVHDSGSGSKEEMGKVNRSYKEEIRSPAVGPVGDTVYN
jgi:hypothetical protein